MKIAINTLAMGTGGNKFYAKMLIRELSKIDKKNQYLIFVSSLNKKDLEIKKPNFKFLEFRHLKNPFLRIFWEQLFLPFLLKKRETDLLYNLSSFDVLFGSCKTIITINNMLPYSKEGTNKENLFAKAKLIFLKFGGIISSKTANTVITLSETARQKLISKYGFEPSKTKAIYLGVNKKELVSQKLSPKLKRYLENDFFLSVAHINRYKKLEKVILGYKKALKKAPSLPLLYLVGKPRDKKYFSELLSLVKKENLQQKVAFLGNLPRGNLGFFYKQAQLLIFNSVAETCPLTLLEAMSFGTPILCSKASVMPEICQKAALYFEPDSISEIAEKIEMSCRNKNLLEQLSQKGKERIKAFSWQKTAQKTLNVFQKVYPLK